MRRSSYKIKNDIYSLKLKHFRQKLHAYNVGYWIGKLFNSFEKYYTVYYTMKA